MTDAPLTNLALYRSMLRIRRIEEAIAESYARQEMRCPVHLSVGQEAAAVGACAVLRASDVVVSTHRCHGHYLAKGGSLERMLGELHGRATGCCGGRGGSMHLFDDDAGVLASVPIVGSNVPLAVGAALAFARAGTGRVAVAFLGDGAVEEGVVHESVNLAACHELPVVFFVEDNTYSVYTPLRQRQPARPLVAVGRAHGIAATEVDGNRVEEVLAAMRGAVDRARAGAGPTWLVARTYRFLEHCGAADDDALGYRPTGELAAWRLKCPVRQQREGLVAAGELDPRTEQAMEAEIAREIAVAFERARTAPEPERESARARVYA